MSLPTCPPPPPPQPPATVAASLGPAAGDQTAGADGVGNVGMAEAGGAGSELDASLQAWLKVGRYLRREGWLQLQPHHRF